MNTVGSPIALPMAELSQAGEARRLAGAMASGLDFSETERARAALVVTEAARNLVLHAVEGELLLQPIERGGRRGIEVVAIDSGPGMASVADCLRDGFSTRRTPGTGLGAIRRLASEFDIYSLPGVGTVLLARLWPARRARVPVEGDPCPHPAPLRFGVLCLPRSGETECGDAWGVDERPDRSRVLVADGLGHGPDAALAARRAVEVLQRHPEAGPVEVLERAHAALRGTRGAAVAVAQLDPRTRTLRFAGVGNIAGVLCEADACRHLLSFSGIVGHELRRIQEQASSWPEGGTLVMHSDGLMSNWRLDDYPGLAARDPSLIAAVLYRDFRRQKAGARGSAAFPPRQDDISIVLVTQARSADI